MNQFAVVSARPRSIAWLIRLAEWPRLEQIVQYNCAVVGGVYNVIIPLNEDDTVSASYRRFLQQYDPDLVVLPPGTGEGSQENADIHPFAYIRWEDVDQIVSVDPTYSNLGTNAPVTYELNSAQSHDTGRKKFVAVADHQYTDYSRLGLIVCGDYTSPLCQDKFWGPIS